MPTASNRMFKLVRSTPERSLIMTFLDKTGY